MPDPDRYHDDVVVLAPSMVMALAWRRFQDSRAERHLRRIAAGEGVFASCTSEHGMGGVQGAVDARKTTATRVDGGFRISGHKIFSPGTKPAPTSIPTPSMRTRSSGHF